GCGLLSPSACAASTCNMPAVTTDVPSYAALLLVRMILPGTRPRGEFALKLRTFAGSTTAPNCDTNAPLSLKKSPVACAACSMVTPDALAMVHVGVWPSAMRTVPTPRSVALLLNRNTGVAPHVT